MTSNKLIKEVQSLLWGELFSGIMFPVLYFLWSNNSILTFNLVTLFIILTLSILLFEGAFYWKLTLNRIRGQKKIDRITIGRVYNYFKLFNLVALSFAAIIMVIFFRSTELSEIILQLLIYSFVMIEYINYFHIRLSFYGKTKLFLQVIKPIRILFYKKGKPSHIAEDISYFKKSKHNSSS